MIPPPPRSTLFPYPTLFRSHLKFSTIDAVKLAGEVGLGGRINMIMQTVFFKLAGVLPVDEAITHLKEAIVKAYGKKGEKVVQMNNAGVDAALDNLVEVNVPAAWASASGSDGEDQKHIPEWVIKVMRPMELQEGDKLPVSAFAVELDGKYDWTGPDGTFPTATSQYEKRGVAISVPAWNPDNCIQCNFCSFVCPHAAIRPVLATEEELTSAPSGFATIPAKGKGLEGFNFRVQVSTLDCTGCGNCANVCPGMKGEKALTLKPLASQTEVQVKNHQFSSQLPVHDDVIGPETVKGSQFRQPLFEFSGACPGCGETPYVKLATQLFGDRMLIANATGCSSIYGGSAPAAPYCVNKNGHGPAWGNSLFEDNAEYGFGMNLAFTARRAHLSRLVSDAIASDVSAEVKAALNEWLASKDLAEGSRVAGTRLVSLLESAAGSNDTLRSEERRVGTECRSRWAP